jgi:hypothetical protein
MADKKKPDKETPDAKKGTAAQEPPEEQLADGGGWSEPMEFGRPGPDLTIPERPTNSLTPEILDIIYGQTSQKTPFLIPNPRKTDSRDEEPGEPTTIYEVDGEEVTENDFLFQSDMLDCITDMIERAEKRVNSLDITHIVSGNKKGPSDYREPILIKWKLSLQDKKMRNHWTKYTQFCLPADECDDIIYEHVIRDSLMVLLKELKEEAEDANFPKAFDGMTRTQNETLIKLNLTIDRVWTAPLVQFHVKDEMVPLNEKYIRKSDIISGSLIEKGYPHLWEIDPSVTIGNVGTQTVRTRWEEMEEETLQRDDPQLDTFAEQAQNNEIDLAHYRLVAMQRDKFWFRPAADPEDDPIPWRSLRYPWESPH